MTDANLVRVMQRQTARKVGLIGYYTVRAGTAAIRERVGQLIVAGGSTARTESRR